MEAKKSPRADLNRYASMFMWLALVLVMFVSWRLIELKNYTSEKYMADNIPNGMREDMEVQRVIRRARPQPLRRLKHRLPAEIRKVDNRSEEEDTEWIPDDEDIPDTTSIDQIETIQPDDEEVILPSEKVESLPVFPGCEKYRGQRQKLKRCLERRLYRFIRQRFDTDILSEYDFPGRVAVYVQFTVDKQGHITQIKARSPYETLQAEAVRVLGRLPEMEPGRQNGHPVAVRFMFPIYLQIE